MAKKKGSEDPIEFTPSSELSDAVEEGAGDEEATQLPAKPERPGPPIFGPDNPTGRPDRPVVNPLGDLPPPEGPIKPDGDGPEGRFRVPPDGVLAVAIYNDVRSGGSCGFDDLAEQDKVKYRAAETTARKWLLGDGLGEGLPEQEAKAEAEAKAKVDAEAAAEARAAEELRKSKEKDK